MDARNAEEPKPEPIDEEEERMISMLIETAEDLHRLGLMSEENLNEMKRIGGRL